MIFIHKNSSKGGIIVKKRVAAFVSAIALLATGAASMGCVWILVDEPNNIKAIKD